MVADEHEKIVEFVRCYLLLQILVIVEEMVEHLLDVQQEVDVER